MMLVNLEPIFGYRLEIESIPIYLDLHQFSAIFLIWGIYYKKLAKHEVRIRIKMFTWQKKAMN